MKHKLCRALGSATPPPIKKILDAGLLEGIFHFTIAYRNFPAPLGPFN
jgi:hypothetical protein